MGDEDLVRSAGFVLMGRRSPGLCSERLEEGTVDLSPVEEGRFVGCALLEEKGCCGVRL